MDDQRDPTDDREPAGGGGADGPAVGSSVPPPGRRSLFDRPLFWLGLVAVGVALAVVLSFAAERTDLSGGPVGDVGNYCQQVRTVQQFTSLSARGTSADVVAQAQTLVQQLTALEAVAPDPVHDDVTAVRQAAQAVLSGVTNYQDGTTEDRSAARSSIAQAVTNGQAAIERMTEYTQEACGIDLSARDTKPPPAGPASTAPPTTT